MARPYRFRNTTREAFGTAISKRYHAAIAAGRFWWKPEAGQRAASEKNRTLALQRSVDVAVLVQSLVVEGFTSLSAQAAELNLRGLKTPRGGQWTRAYIRTCLSRVKP